MSGDPSRKAYPGRCFADGTCIKKPLGAAQIGLPGAQKSLSLVFWRALIDVGF
jgi:hypothetical protein